MGAPSNDLSHEIISAMSSLNMEPEPIVPAPVRDPDSNPLYLSQTDVWAKHAMEHLHAAMGLIHERTESSFEEKLLQLPQLSDGIRDRIASMAYRHFIQGD